MKPEVAPKLIINYDEKALVPFPTSGLPFVTKSFALVEAAGRRRNRARYPKLVGILSLFQSCGTQITSLSLDDIYLYPETLNDILSQTPNLKAIYMFDITVHHSTFKPQLPALPHLTTLLLNEVDMDCRKERKKKRSWFFEPYIHQLINLEIGPPFVSDPPPPLKAIQQNLKQLKVYQPRRNFLVESEAAPFLQRLSILDSTESCIDYNFLEVIDYIDKFADSLVHLHLDIEWYNMTVGKETYRMGFGSRFFPCKSKLINQRDPVRKQLINMCNGMPHASKTFPNLKTVAVHYPDKDEDIVVALLAKILLVKFPMLQNLMLIHFEAFSYSHWDKVEAKRTVMDRRDCADDAASVREFLESQDYWQICPRLRRITVLYEANYDTPHHIVFQEIR